MTDKYLMRIHLFHVMILFVFYRNMVSPFFISICCGIMAISKIIKSAQNSIDLLDNYIDESVLTLLSKRNKDVRVTIYTKSISKQLKLDLDRFHELSEPIEIKEFTKSHDRFLIVDQTEIYHLGASLKDLGKKWFAFSKLNIDAVELLGKL